MSDLQDIRTVPAADVSQRRFHDRVVTGAGDGIGAASSARFADEGAHVIVCDANDTAAVSVADNPTSRGLRAQARVFDVTDADVCLRSQNRPSASTRASTSWSTMPDSIAAAIYSHSATTIGRSLRGQRRCDVPPVPRGLSHMIAAGRGAIVNTASQWGLHPALGHIAYNVSKAAVLSFTQNLARDYAPYNVRVNAVCPGEIHTPMLESGLARKGLTVADLDKKVPFGRIGRPEEVAALVAFVASDEAPFICGAAVEITGAQAVS